MTLLKGHVVVVTGGAGEGSIGEGIAKRCAEHGATVVVTSRKRASAEDAAKRIGPLAHGEALDLGSDDDARAFVGRVLRAHGRIDGVVHNAGAPVTEWERGFLSVPPEDFARVFAVDVVGAIRLSQAALPHMIERGSGSLVFTSSTASLAGYEHLHEFSPAKAGVLGLMRGLAAEFGARGIRSNAVAYGNVGSPATLGALTPEQRDALANESPMRRWGTPRDAAGGSVFLLSDLASFVNGQVLVIDGGTVMR